MINALHGNGEQNSVKPIQMVHAEVQSYRKHFIILIPINFSMFWRTFLITACRNLLRELKN